MKLSVFVGNDDVAVLESPNELKSVLTYHSDVAARALVSLTMPVRSESYVWDDEIHPFFRMNLPEGYLLQVLQERFGPHIGSSKINLLSVVGRNTIGRVRVAPVGAPIDEPPRPIDVREILQGDNSESSFAALVREHATSGVSGVVPKFLDAGREKFLKSTIVSHRHIIKGSSERLPHVALNEHLCMQVCARVTSAAKTSISNDGHALVVDRFDVDDNGQMHWAMEDFCALLGMRPEQKYETTWERIAKAVRDHVKGEHRQATFERLGIVLLLTYALRNPDCHSKNIALRYTSRDDAELTPIYDMLTIVAYDEYAQNPPGISFGGKKTWLPGRNLRDFMARVFGITVQRQQTLVETISDAIADTVPAVRQAMLDHPTFSDIGKRMLLAWREGIDTLRDQRIYGLTPYPHSQAITSFSPPTQRTRQSRRIDRSELAAPRTPKPKKRT